MESVTIISKQLWNECFPMVTRIPRLMDQKFLISSWKSSGGASSVQTVGGVIFGVRFMVDLVDSSEDWVEGSKTSAKEQESRSSSSLFQTWRAVVGREVESTPPSPVDSGLEHLPIKNLFGDCNEGNLFLYSVECEFFPINLRRDESVKETREDILCLEPPNSNNKS